MQGSGIACAVSGAVMGEKPRESKEAPGPNQASGERPSAQSAAWALIPKRGTLSALAKSAQRCRACDLYKNATQAVFGEGEKSARLLLVGEQPGDKEDLAGRPFVGPAGQLLDELLEKAGLPRSEIYLTNAVKHFKWEPRGKVRLHKKPTLGEVSACRPWLEAEIDLLRPSGIVCLGATALQAIRGSQARITRDRGQFFDTAWGGWLMATFHPSAVLRAPDPKLRHEMRSQLERDLKSAARRLAP
jgi:uracil-DNA glycosylase family protein